VTAEEDFPATGIGDSPPYLHDDWLLTLDDIGEFFNLILGVKLAMQEKKGLGGVPPRVGNDPRAF
jgi:hypothetical protein